MATPYLAEIKLVSFNFPPKGWAFCNGQTLPINQYTALFSLLGTTYGGNGTTTFQLPNLQGRAIVHMGQGSGQFNYVIGSLGGSEDIALDIAELPSHNHTLAISASPGTASDPALAAIAVSPATLGDVFASSINANEAAVMPSETIYPYGGTLPHENRMPFLALAYIIALQGIFPSPN